MTIGDGRYERIAHLLIISWNKFNRLLKDSIESWLDAILMGKGNEKLALLFFQSIIQLLQSWKSQQQRGTG